jgi:hypothetical protein
VIVLDPTDYQASGAVSFSKLKVADSCLYLYWKRFIARLAKGDEDTKAMRLGSAAHALMLEGPVAFAERYVTKPETYKNDKGEEKDWNANAIVCRAWEDNQRSLGRTVLTPAEAELLFQMRESLLGNADAVNLLSVGTPELAIRRPFPALNLELQGRLDWFNPASGVVVDLKTIECLDDLPREIERRKYFQQLAFYRHLAAEEFGALDIRCAIIGVEKAEPHRCGVYYLRSDLLDIGDARNAATLTMVANAYRTGDWGGNPSTREIGPSLELWASEPAALGELTGA